MPITAPQILSKNPWESMPFSMDFSNILADSETISSINSITSELIGGGSSDLTISDESIVDDTVVFTIAGGTHAKRYRIEVRIVTSTGSHREGDGTLKVSDK